MTKTNLEIEDLVDKFIDSNDQSYYRNEFVKDLATLLQQRMDEIVKTVEDKEKWISDLINGSGYCTYCIDHVSQHEGIEKPKCGCDYYNRAISDVLNIIKSVDKK